jgi:ribosome-binding protein aMBF1 (putative translation factor)
MGAVLRETVRKARCEKSWSVEQLSKRSGVPARLVRELDR